MMRIMCGIIQFVMFGFMIKKQGLSIRAYWREHLSFKQYLKSIEGK